MEEEIVADVQCCDTWIGYIRIKESDKSLRIDLSKTIFDPVLDINEKAMEAVASVANEEHYDIKSLAQIISSRTKGEVKLLIWQ